MAFRVAETAATTLVVALVEVTVGAAPLVLAPAEAVTTAAIIITPADDWESAASLAFAFAEEKDVALVLALGDCCCAHHLA